VTAASGIRLVLVAIAVALCVLFPMPSSASEQAHQEPRDAGTASDVPRIFDPQGPRLLLDPSDADAQLWCRRIAYLETWLRDFETKNPQDPKLPLIRQHLGHMKLERRCPARWPPLP
jgi:hypothetical protein